MILDLPQAMQKSWAIFGVFRRLGFSADDIFFIPNTYEPGKGHAMLVILKAQHKTFTVTTGYVDLSEEKFVELWLTFVNQISDEKEEDLELALERSLTSLERVDILFALDAKGFVFPRTLS